MHQRPATSCRLRSSLLDLLPRALVGLSGLLTLAGLGTLAGCSAGSDSTSSPGSGFSVAEISVVEAEVWKINRPIDVRFSADVDFETVSLNTVSLKDPNGAPATGQFSLLADGRTVRFEPSCPTLADSSDAGLLPDTEYLLHVLGTQSGGVTVTSTGGTPLGESRTVRFRTPDSLDPQVLFLDPTPGPPRALVRGRDGVAEDALLATYLEVGGDDTQRAYFQWDPETQSVSLAAEDFLPEDGNVPLNLYSMQASRIAVLVFIDQPVDPSALNINASRLSIEYRVPGSSEWATVITEVELVANCTESGSVLRLEPLGVLPQAAGLRVNLRQGFRDLTGDQSLLEAVEFAVMQTTTGANPVPGTDSDAVSADELLESFVIGGGGPGSLEDVNAGFADPFADWGDGRLQASFDFGGSGGPGGNFDWHLSPGETRILDSTVDTIVGGPGGVPTISTLVVGGVVDVRDLFVPEGAVLLVQGPNPLTILASGKVRVDGQISVRGSNAESVATLDTTHLPQPGAAGNAGGGNGGTASFLTNASTPRGESGQGAFGADSAGGQGGESSYSPNTLVERRAGGGGGGSFGRDVFHAWDNNTPEDDSDDVMVLCQNVAGLDGEDGFDGGPLGTGAESQTERARGGAQGPYPFFDQSDENDFYGAMLVNPGTPVETLVLGEFDRIWAGAGGGGGGDAVKSDSFPLIPFINTGDEKGAGGGGGGGAMLILAIGEVIIGPEGSLSAEGGDGGGGENTNFFDRVGGGSGGGSGGHIVVSTASTITIEGNGSVNAGPWYNDILGGHKARAFNAVGGQGGAGEGSEGGANEDGPMVWRCDAIPFDHFILDVPSPPITNPCFRSLAGVGTTEAEPFLWDDPDLQALAAAGGDGTPGIIQLHVDDPVNNIVFTEDPASYGEGVDVTLWFAPPPLGWIAPDDANHMVPFFGRTSSAQSKWIPLGLARVNPDDNPVLLAFEGTESDGDIPHDDDLVALDAPILGPEPLAQSPTPPYVSGDDARTIVLDASDLIGAQELYRRNPALVRFFTLRLSEDGGDEFEDFEVEATTYDPITDRLSLSVGGVDPIALPGVSAAATLVSLLRRDFGVETFQTLDAYAAETGIRVLFDATLANTIDGSPDVESSYSSYFGGAMTGDIDALQSGPFLGVEWDFFRFRVLFDLDAQDSGSVDENTPRPALRFLRVPFTF